MDSFQADDGERIHVDIRGQGKPLVVLHGWTSSHQEWLPYAFDLKDHFRVYCWDARGHGQHRLQDSNSATVQRMAGDLRCLLERYELRRAVLLGHSMGALTVWEYVRQYGCDRLAKLCLIDQSPRLLTDTDWRLGIYGDFPAWRNREFIVLLRSNFAEAVLRLAADGHNPRFTQNYRRNSKGIRQLREYLHGLSPRPLIDCWESLTAADYREVLEVISVPTLLIYGDQSQFYQAGTARYVQERIADADLHIYRGTDHSPHLWQRDRFVSDLRSFLQRPETLD